MNFRRLVLVVVSSFVATSTLFAQNETDTLAVVKELEKNYEQLLNSVDGSVSMSDSLRAALINQVEKNKGRKGSVYRIRIYFDNSQNARNVSTQVVDTFKVYYPNIPIYRSYSNPYFKVTVGDFRTKSDAMRFLEAIKPKYPAVFLVKETFSTI